MISVLICSINPDFLLQVEANIKQTIGIDFEILYFDNRIEKKGICQVYNDLAMKARFEYLCFVHEDVLFETPAWGKKLLEIFSGNSSIGLIGVAGSKYKSHYFSGWYNNIKELDCANILHRYSYGDRRLFLSPDESQKQQEVVCIDGVFMCCTKDVWQKFKFNDKDFQGFHFYDIDFSLRTAMHYTVIVTFEISLIHFTSGGDFGNNWVQNAFKFHKLQLPLSSLTNFTGTADNIIVKTWLDWLKNFKITLSNKLHWIFAQKLYLNPGNYYSILKFLLYEPLGMRYLHNFLKRNGKRN
jgi:hypothetical protein